MEIDLHQIHEILMKIQLKSKERQNHEIRLKEFKQEVHEHLMMELQHEHEQKLKHLEKKLEHYDKKNCEKIMNKNMNKNDKSVREKI